MPLYKYLTIETAKRVIAGSIRFTQPGAFNDPFEMLPELYVPESFGEKNLNIRFSVTGERRDPPIGELEVDFEHDQCNDINSRKILASLNQSIGILCLTQNPKSLLMWSHYADEYSGAVIEFDEDHEFFEGKFEVDYREHRPKKDISSYLTSTESFVPIAELCVKSKEWEYENEIRLVRSLNDCNKVAENGRFPIYVMDVPADAIKSIILGERASVEEQKAIWELVKDTKVSLSLSAISNWGYEFRPELIKFDVPLSEANPMISPRTAHIFSDAAGDLGEMARWAIKEHKMSEIVNDSV